MTDSNTTLFLEQRPRTPNLPRPTTIAPPMTGPSTTASPETSIGPETTAGPVDDAVREIILYWHLVLNGFCTRKIACKCCRT